MTDRVTPINNIPPLNLGGINSHKGYPDVGARVVCVFVGPPVTRLCLSVHQHVHLTPVTAQLPTRQVCFRQYYLSTNTI